MPKFAQQMKKGNKKYTLRTTLLSLLVIVAVLLGVYAAGIYQIYHFNSEMEIPEGTDNVIARFSPDDDGYIYDASGNRVTLDMGSRHSFISRKSLEKLKSEGYDAKEQQTLIYTTDQSGHYKIYTRKVVMPVCFYVDPDSDDTVTFDNVEILISDREDGNVLGMDFVEKFVVERDKDTGDISLLRDVPDQYTYVCDLNGHDSALGDIIGYSRRVYLTLQVNDDDPKNYYLDTGSGIRSCELVQPLKDISKATSKVVVDSVTGMATQNYCRVLIGNRMRFARVTYSDSLHTDEYSINPFKVFNRSVVLDLPNKKLYYLKISDPADSMPV